MDRDEMSNHYRGPPIDALHIVSVHLAKQFQRRRFLKKFTKDDGRRRQTPTIGNSSPDPLGHVSKQKGYRS
jgi:hypothetical protein